MKPRKPFSTIGCALQVLFRAWSSVLLMWGVQCVTAQTVSLQSLLQEMTDREAVARFPNPMYQCLQASSYNRASTNRLQPNQDTTGWFADSDGTGFIRTEQINGKTEWVIMEHNGPGCLTKLWTPFFYYGFNDRKGPNVRVYLDGDKNPVLDESLIELVTGKGAFKPPLSSQTARAGDSYMPIPFARSCKITMAAKPFYYLINYRAYPEGTKVESFTRQAYEATTIEIERAGKTLTAPPMPDTGEPQESMDLQPGSTLEMAFPSGPTVIKQLTLQLPGAVAHPEILRSTVLSMSFDEKESVWTPIGDFFCSADALHPIQTWQRTVTADGTFVSRWAMPFQKSAKLRLLNLGRETVQAKVRADTGPWDWDDRSMHFHANWRPDDVVAGTPFQDWNYIDIRGQGVFVGDAWTVLNVQGSWWGEGDEKIYVDGAWDAGFPTHFGTGTEDYYGWAGGEVPTRQDEFSVPFLANARVGGLDGRTTGFNICTRTRSLDAIPFAKRLVFDMESSFGTDIRNPWNLLGYSAVTFWYAKPGASHNRPARPIEAARPIMAVADVKRKADSIEETLRRCEGQDVLVYTESRERPLKAAQSLAANWPTQSAGLKPAFEGEAQPGEFFVFQIAVYALRDTGSVSVNFQPLTGGNREIPASALRCLSLGGTNHLGQNFAKNISLKRGELQVLWIGIQVPENAKGVFAGTAKVSTAPGKSISVSIKLQVNGPPVSDGGDSVAKNLSRLRWLDSTVGTEAVVTKPFTAIQVSGRTIKILGRELELGEEGLPAQVTSYFSPANTRVQESAREVLSRRADFVVETTTGRVQWVSKFAGSKQTDLEAKWNAISTGDGLRAETRGRLDYTGSGEVHLRVIAERDVELKDARLEVPFRQDVARYFMGLNHQGGRRPDAVYWKWDVKKRQDCFWLGDVNAGLMLRFKDAEYLRPPVNIYYSFRPLSLPKSWGNGGAGGVNLAPAEKDCVLLNAYSGPRALKKGEALDFIFEIYLTPFRTLDTEKQWAVRFTHVGGPGRQPVDDAVAQADAAHGPNAVNVHHASFYAPYINYPYGDDSFGAFRELVNRAHAKGVKLRVYYTTREITQNMPELFPLHSLNGEIILPGPGRNARTLIHPNGPHTWLTENLGSQFIPAWEAHVGSPYAELDLSVITTPDSRWNNFYLEGLRWLALKSDFDGMYIDDTALDAKSLQRARRILDSRPGRLIDLHTWNHFNGWAGFANNLTIYMEILPYLDRLWLGEGFDANAASPEFWLVEMSGLPFGIMSEMLDGANPWRGMVFGETARLPWSGDPRGMWKIWDEFGIQGTELLPFFASECPVKTDQPNVLATVYRKKGRSFVALGSWAKEKVEVNLAIDWKSLGLDAAKARVYSPAIPGMQEEKQWKPGESIPVAPKRGWFLVMDEEQRGAGDSAAKESQIDQATLDAWSAPYRGWHYYTDPVIPSDFKIPGNEKFHSFDVPTVYQVREEPGKWFMSFIGFNGQGYNSFVVESTNLVHWSNPRLAMGFGPTNEFDHGGCVIGAFLYESYDIKAQRLLKRREGKYWSLYGCYPRQGGYELRPGYEGVAVSQNGLTWKRAKNAPILSVHDSDCGSWEKDCIYQPWLVEHAALFYNFYNAANGGMEQMGGATSTNLLDWKRYLANPIIRNSPDGYNAQFCSDGKVFWDRDHWVMFFFGVGKGGAHIMVAFSRDLKQWTPHPEPLYKAGGHPGGLDSTYAHKISLVYNSNEDRFYMYYCAVGRRGRCIGLLTSRPLTLN